MRTLIGILIVVIGVAAAAVYLSAFIVRQTEQAIVLQFGQPVSVINPYTTDDTGKVVNGAGLYWKIPVIQTVDYFDKRILDLDLPPQEVIASDQKRLVVDAFARFRIVDPLEFYKTVSNETRARQRLTDLLGASLRSVLGAATFQDVVRDQRASLMSQILERLNNEAKSLGINVVDVRIRRADLPEANSEAIYGRMQTERKQEADEIRARGREAANRIRARADREVTEIKAEATREADELRGQGDAERNRVFADAFGKDPDFFNFYRSMQAYEKGLKSNDTRLVISPDSEFFRFFGSARGTGAAPAGQ